MEKPSNYKIKKFIKYLSKLEIFRWNHSGYQTPDPELVEVVKWLNELSSQPTE